jgi:hypothetical protein
MTDIIRINDTTDETNALAEYAPDTNPAIAYLASLQSEHSRRTMKRCLQLMATLVLGEDTPDAWARLEWGSLRATHVKASVVALGEYVSPRTGKVLSPTSVNKHIAPLLGVYFSLRPC